MAVLFLVSLTMLVSACAARTGASTSCNPATADFMYAGLPVYHSCAVDRPAEPPRGGLPLLNYTGSLSQTCFRAVIDFVVDTSGRPAQETARIVRQSDPGFLEAVIGSLGGMRYTPALKDGKRVQQLTRYSRTMQVRASGAGAPRPCE